ncbi:glucose-6-phosphate dehydrogenase assembly protein OpcA [Microcoleus sp. FACHB-831]|uniref:glucose-6-phosphate dehydrogenase assembly protein OpcA n=1 Tax=Microcoleus sp. FACHB-831 TaxID=2692827 RepID=UPI001682C88D|nr:glucose-6-phosphate dehydrogenase assembly protein OpcA [Microcoleus sp. FACHB-831]MBD1923234.1 glucose-6-phosphate dehydrogenase assembly protein OpcA [Microcoleus sp. FACHB-831]
MTTQSPPVVSLQGPTDVSLSEIEAELTKIWQSYNSTSSNGDAPAASRATTFTFIVYEPEETQQLLAALGFYTGPIDGIAGPRTTSAVKDAQKAYGLPRTGKADAEILSRLREDLAKRRASTTLKEDNSNDGVLSTVNITGYGVADAIAASNPCRIIALCPQSGQDEGVRAQVSAYCPVHKQSQNSLICCEYITLQGTAEALERIGGLVTALLIGGLPKFLWWKATPEPQNALFKRLSAACNSVIVDSCAFGEPESDVLRIQSLLEQGTPIADLNWRRLAAWQELTAEAFDPPERREALQEVDKVTINYEKGNPAQALMFLGWLGSRLKWHPVSYKQEGGDYDIKRIHFVTTDQRPVEAELAGIPTADWGEIPGDLIALRLSSTNLNADCCTVLCSQTSGCMRMEAGGGAQACRFEQVAPLSDQKAEFLLGQQLRRWGQDMLYTESMIVTAEILKLANG